mmetsp:Transcript_20934/g.34571  ORF Transcript_20934/g.34571 Transcript_20934/m.34571 type:complete len:80 (+) Transcript_20934:1397-1636(+)
MSFLEAVPGAAPVFVSFLKVVAGAIPAGSLKRFVASVPVAETAVSARILACAPNRFSALEQAFLSCYGVTAGLSPARKV